MDNRELINTGLKKEFHGKAEVGAKYIAKFPLSAERDYIRVINELMINEYKRVLSRHLPELVRIMKSSEGNLSLKNVDDAKSKKENEKKRREKRFETIDNTIIRLKVVLDSISRELAQSFGLYGLKRKLNDIANSCQRQAKSEWKKTVRKTLGINILDDYYDGDFYREILEKWISDNVDLISTIPNKSLAEMKEIIMNDYLDGKPITKIVQDINKHYSMSKSHAKFIARDQMGKLNTKITKHQQESAGVSKYKWRTVGDGRVRNDHKALNNKTFSWSNPPIVDRKSGRRAHPGEDYECRCIALPVFDFDNMDIPVDGRREVTAQMINRQKGG